jgi:glycine dehydrogenase subunit 1
MTMRYLPLTDTDRTAMLATIGASSIDDLFIDVPEHAPLTGTCRPWRERTAQRGTARSFSAAARTSITFPPASII